VSPQS